jgi:hypothetical protein
VSHSYQTWFTWLSRNLCLYVWVAWPCDHEVRITSTCQMGQVRSNTSICDKIQGKKYSGWCTIAQACTSFNLKCWIIKIWVCKRFIWCCWCHFNKVYKACENLAFYNIYRFNGYLFLKNYVCLVVLYVNCLFVKLMRVV